MFGSKLIDTLQVILNLIQICCYPVKTKKFARSLLFKLCRCRDVEYSVEKLSLVKVEMQITGRGAL